MTDDFLLAVCLTAGCWLALRGLHFAGTLLVLLGFPCVASLAVDALSTAITVTDLVLWILIAALTIDDWVQAPLAESGTK